LRKTFKKNENQRNAQEKKEIDKEIDTNRCIGKVEEG
jgi:hypothetical protein